MTLSPSDGLRLPLNDSGDPAFQCRLAAVYAHALEGRSYRKLAERLGVNQETLRRMVVTRTCSVKLLTPLCEAFEINAHWLLTGMGEPTRRDERRAQLAKATPTELCRALAEKLAIATRFFDQGSQHAMMNIGDPRPVAGPSAPDDEMHGVEQLYA